MNPGEIVSVYNWFDAGREWLGLARLVCCAERDVTKEQWFITWVYKATKDSRVYTFETVTIAIDGLGRPKFGHPLEAYTIRTRPGWPYVPR